MSRLTARTRRPGALSVLLLIGLLPLSVTPSAGASASPRVLPIPAQAAQVQQVEQVELPRTRLAFVTQTPWAPADAEFVIVVRISLAPGDDPSALELDATVFPAVASRTAFAESLEGRGLRPPMSVPQRLAVPQLPTNPDGSVSVRVPAPPTRRNGVHPVRVELRDIAANNTVDRFITHLTYLPEPNVGPRLAVGMVLPLHSPPSLDAEGARRPVQGEQLAATAQAIQVAGSIPVSITPTPETLAALVAAGGADGGMLTALRQVASQGRLVGGSYVPVSLPTMLASNLRKEVEVGLQKGEEVLNATLRVPPDTSTWAAQEPLDAASVDLLAARGVDRIVATDAALTPTGDRLLTLTRPFLLAGEKETVPAVAADAALSSYFDAANPALAALHLLSDLAVLHLDLPGDRRAAVAMPSRSWQPTRPFVDNLVSGLTANPILEPVEIQTLFASVTPEAVNGRGTLVRRPVVAPVVTRTELARDVNLARRRLASLDLVLGPGNLVTSELAERLLLVQSVDLPTDRESDPYLAGVRRAISGQLEGVEMPEDRSITLTARRGEIPVTFRNRSGHPVRMAVRLESDKLSFPAGERQELDLTRLNTTHRFPVVARTSGAFPIRITLESPDGQLVAGEATLTVRSTAASGVGVAISAGAALFLAVWWGRNLSKTARIRKTGRLNSAGQPETIETIEGEA